MAFICYFWAWKQAIKELMQLLQRRVHCLCFMLLEPLHRSSMWPSWLTALSGKGEFHIFIASHLSLTVGAQHRKLLGESPSASWSWRMAHLGLSAFFSTCSAWPREQPGIRGHGMGAPVGTNAQTGKMPLSHPQGQAKQNTNGGVARGCSTAWPPTGWKRHFIKQGGKGKKNNNFALLMPPSRLEGVPWGQGQAAPLGKGCALHKKELVPARWWGQEARAPWSKNGSRKKREREI